MSVVANIRANWSWGHPLWGLAFGFILAVTDLRLTPVDELGEFAYIGIEAFAFMAFAFVGLLVLGITALLGIAPKTQAIAALAAGAIVAVGCLVAGPLAPWIYNSYDVPTERFMVLPILAAALVILGGILLALQKAPVAEIIGLSSVTTVTLVTFVQESPLLWAAMGAVVVTYAWLIPNLSAPARTSGLVLHMLALLGFLQLRPEWFTWTPFPFLTFAPIYIVVQFLRTQGTPREITWWAGAVVSLGTAALGTSTTIANIMKGLPVVESLAMLGGGLAFTALFAWFWHRGAGPHPRGATQMPSLEQAAS